MRKFLVLTVLAGLTILFVVQKRNESAKPAPSEKKVAVQNTTSSQTPRPASEHNWMKNSLDRATDVKRQVAQQRKEDGTR
jgi:hypothetical protein